MVEGKRTDKTIENSKTSDQSNSPSKQTRRHSEAAAKIRSKSPAREPPLRSYDNSTYPTQAPGYQPAQAPGYQPAQAPGYQPAQVPGYQPAQVPGYQPAQVPGYQPAQVPGYQPAQALGYQTAKHSKQFAGYRSHPSSAEVSASPTRSPGQNRPNRVQAAPIVYSHARPTVPMKCFVHTATTGSCVAGGYRGPDPPRRTRPLHGNGLHPAPLVGKQRAGMTPGMVPLSNGAIYAPQYMEAVPKFGHQSPMSKR